MGKKAIIVDGASFYNMMRCLGVRRPKISVLRKILGKKIGTEKVYGYPIFTLSLKNSHVLFEEQMRQQGFEPVVKDSKTGKDDEYIIRAIESIDPKRIKEIILVSSDGDYIECLTKKASEGIKIYWVATKAIDPRSNRPVVGAELRYSFVSGVFQFIELAEFKDQLAGFLERTVLEKIALV